MAMVRESDSHLAPRRAAYVAPAALRKMKTFALTSPKQLALQKSLTPGHGFHSFAARANLGVEHRSK